MSKAMVEAAYHGRIDECRLSLEKGVPADSCNEFRESALNLSARYGHIQIVELLIRHGADLELEDYYGNTGLSIASACGRLEIANLLLTHGAKVNIKNKLGWTPLMQSAFRPYVDVVELLLKAGADPNAVADQERNVTALMLTAGRGCQPAVNLLLSHGARPDAQDTLRLTPHDHAMLEGFAHVAASLPSVYEGPPDWKRYLKDTKVDHSACLICKDIPDNGDEKIGRLGDDYRKYFFKLMAPLTLIPETKTDYKEYKIEGLYQCPVCQCFYLRETIEDTDYNGGITLYLTRLDDVTARRYYAENSKWAVPDTSPK